MDMMGNTSSLTMFDTLKELIKNKPEKLLRVKGKKNEFWDIMSGNQSEFLPDSTESKGVEA